MIGNEYDGGNIFGALVVIGAVLWGVSWWVPETPRHDYVAEFTYKGDDRNSAIYCNGYGDCRHEPKH